MHHPQKRLIALGLGLGLVASMASAQKEFGGSPPSRRLELRSTCPTCELPPVDVALLELEDLSRSKDQPFRYGEVVPVDEGLENSGVWEELPNGDRVWRLRVASAGAFSLGLRFSRFQLPEGAELFVYDDERTVQRGAYTWLNNKPNGRFAIQPTPGDALVLEYFEPVTVDAPGELVLEGVVHDYRDVLGIREKSGGFGSSGNCMVDVGCSEGMPWQDQIASVVFIDRGGLCCSGVLMNNTLLDGTPLLLSAEHCGTLDDAIFTFNYQRSGCDAGPAPTGDTLLGSVQLVEDTVLDYQLVRLVDEIPVGYDVRLAGWDHSDVRPASAFTIHHPSGDAKKISFEDDSPKQTGTQWEIKNWEKGSTEGGSSGSPLFSPEGRVIGELCCGAADCLFPDGDFYGRLGLQWDGLGEFLDPMDAGVLTLDAFDPNGLTPVFALTGVGPDPLPSLMPSTSQDVSVWGSGFTSGTTVDFEGVPVGSQSWTVASRSRIKLDLPQVLTTGPHTITVHEGGTSIDLLVAVEPPPTPVHQAGTGDPGNVIAGTGVDLYYGGQPFDMHVAYFSESNLPSIHPALALDLGNSFMELFVLRIVTIPPDGFLMEHSVPRGLFGVTIYSQSACFTCPAPFPVSNLQETFVFF